MNEAIREVLDSTPDSKDIINDVYGAWLALRVAVGREEAQRLLSVLAGASEFEDAEPAIRAALMKEF